jgi:Phytanoyl-CoA dioxygenase (PhyH)
MKQTKMNSIENKIADKFETGKTGLFYIKRLWSKLLLNSTINKTIRDEAVLDDAVMDILGLGYLPTYQFINTKKPSFSEFEDWIIDCNAGTISSTLLQQCNCLIKDNQITYPPNDIPPVLSAEDLKHWQEFGYVIVRNAISDADCIATNNLIWGYLDMQENNPLSWYKTHESIQGIMVALFNHPQINKNRHSLRIRKAYEQIWDTNQLIVTADKVGFNPPETPAYKFRGSGLHWDVSLTSPIPFGTQGILYLTDTTVNQGALTVIPSFQHKIHNWLETLGSQKNPRDEIAGLQGAVPIAANAGDFIIWHHCLPHGASPNTANKPRLVQYINYYNPFVDKQLEWK